MTAEDVPSVPEVTLSDAAAEPADGPTVKLFTMEDLAKHASYKDCWMLIDGKVCPKTGIYFHMYATIPNRGSQKPWRLQT